MDRLFRQSGLYRKKWDEKHHADGSTYGEETLNKAIESTENVYSPKEDNPIYEYIKYNVSPYVKKTSHTLN